MALPEDLRELVRRIERLGDGATASAELLHVAAAHAPAFLVLADAAGHFLWVNTTLPSLTRADVLGSTVYDFTAPDDHATIRAAFGRVFGTGATDRYACYGPGKRGPRSRYDNWLSPVIDDGRVVAVVIVTRDMSEEWQLHDALRDREQRLSLALHASGMGMWRFDFRAMNVELDVRARAIYGIEQESMPSLVFTTRHIHPDDRASADAAALECMRAKRPYASENRIVRSDGAVRWVAITGAPIHGDDGAPVALLGTVSDITERRELEVHARQAQQMEAMGQLTAGVAHNFNNMLAAIIPTLQIAEREVQPITVPLVQGASHAAERAAQLVRDLMTFAGRNRRAERKAEAPLAIVERTLRLCRGTFERGIELEVDVDPALPTVLVDAGQIEQALLNLLLNARDAVLEGGRTRAPRVTVRAATEGTSPEARVALSVSDNGPGVPEHLRDRVFDPFFTTKDVGRGTGLGLSTAYAILREHRGSIRCENAPGGGACFTLLVPVAEAEAHASERPPGATPRRASGSVLIVDDDPHVRVTLQRLLTDAGYDAREASSGDEALASLARDGFVDVVILDLNMPGLPWTKVVDRVRAELPSTRVIAFTGGTTDPQPELVDGWLRKPAAPEVLLEAIAKLRGAPT